MELVNNVSENGSTVSDGAEQKGTDVEKASLEHDSKGMNAQVTAIEAIDEYPNVFRRTAIVLGVALALFCVGVDMTIVATAIPRITDQFSGIELVGWYGSSFFITLACCQPFWGKVYQYFSLKYTFMVGIFLFELGSLLSGVAPSSTVLIIGRAITGAGGAGIATGGYAILSVIVRPEVRPIFTGLVTTVYSIANVVGPIMGGAFAEHATWRWCFYVNLPFGGTSAVAIFLFYRSPKKVRPKELVPLKEKLSQLDPIGILLALGTLLCFARALQVAGIIMSWKSAEVIGLLTASGVMALLFILSQWILDDRAMMVTRILKIRIVAIGMVYGFLHEGAFFTLLYALPIYFQAASGVSPGEAGIRNVPLLVSCGIGSLAAGLLISKFKHFVPLMVWASAGGCIGTGLIYTLDVNSPASQWIGYQVLAGLAFGTGLPLGIIAGQAGSLQEDLPSTTAMLLFAFNIGSSFSLITAQSLLDNLLYTGLPSLAPTVSPAAVINAGATEIRTSFPPEAVPGVVDAYLHGLRGIYILVIAFTGAATLAAMANRWQKLTL
ncbi:hypothetical protein MMC25_007791 [Agyrium rufum]|nr:hypothetical protein [Agyrium rufum]